MKNILKKVKEINYLMLSLIVGLSFVAYQFNIVLYFSLYLVPLYLLEKFITGDDKRMIGLLISIVLWLTLNENLYVMDTIIVTVKQVSYIKALINNLILAWVNIIIYSYAFYSLYFLIKNTKLVVFIKNNFQYIVLGTIIINILTFASLHSYENINKIFYLYALIFALLYTLLLYKIVSKNIGILINFVIAISPLITVICAEIIVFLIVQAFYSYEGSKRFYCMTSLTFINYFQITSISSVILYFLPQGHNNFPRLSRYVIMLFLLIIVGIVIQFNYFNFLQY